MGASHLVKKIFGQKSNGTGKVPGKFSEDLEIRLSEYTLVEFPE